MLRTLNDELQSSFNSDSYDSSIQHRPIEDLLADWEIAKIDELTAHQRRLEVEKELCGVLQAPDEGQKTYRVLGWRVTRTNEFRYSGSVSSVVEIQQSLQLPVLTKSVLDASALKKLRKAQPAEFNVLVESGALTVTQAKPHFEVVRAPSPKLEKT